MSFNKKYKKFHTKIKGIITTFWIEPSIQGIMFASQNALKYALQDVTYTCMIIEVINENNSILR